MSLETNLRQVNVYLLTYLGSKESRFVLGVYLDNEHLFHKSFEIPETDAGRLAICSLVSAFGTFNQIFRARDINLFTNDLEIEKIVHVDTTIEDMSKYPSYLVETLGFLIKDYNLVLRTDYDVDKVNFLVQDMLTSADIISVVDPGKIDEIPRKS